PLLRTAAAVAGTVGAVCVAVAVLAGRDLAGLLTALFVLAVVVGALLATRRVRSSLLDVVAALRGRRGAVAEPDAPGGRP
ncbi:MAG: hypothetical protein WCA46_04675, partial [Actinocatenispora sp.]